MSSLKSVALLVFALSFASFRVAAAGPEFLEVPIASYRVEFFGIEQQQLAHISFVLDDGNLWMLRVNCSPSPQHATPNLCNNASSNWQLVNAVDAAIRRGEKVRICFSRFSPEDWQNILLHEGSFHGVLLGLSYRGYWVYPRPQNMPKDQFVAEPCYRWLRGLN